MVSCPVLWILWCFQEKLLVFNVLSFFFFFLWVQCLWLPNSVSVNIWTRRSSIDFHLIHLMVIYWAWSVARTLYLIWLGHRHSQSKPLSLGTIWGHFHGVYFVCQTEPRFPIPGLCVYILLPQATFSQTSPSIHILKSSRVPQEHFKILCLHFNCNIKFRIA